VHVFSNAATDLLRPARSGDRIRSPIGSDAGLTRPRQPIRTWNDGTKITGHKLELIETGGHARKRPFPGVSVRPRSAG
jgi:hypothetical protein